MAQNASWICSGLSIIILVVRTIVSHSTPHVTKLSQFLCICSILIITMRIPVVHFTLKFGTAGDLVTSSGAKTRHASPDVKAGSLLVLFARILVTTYFWLQVSLLLRFYMRVLGHIVWISKAIRIAWLTIFSTYAICLLITFLECRPFSRYWQIQPKPDRCTLAYAQIFAQGIFNILLDCILLVIAFPLLTFTKASTRKNIQITILVALGLVCIIVTGIKLATVVAANSQQKARTLWASIQILVSTFVANVPTIYGCVRLKIQHRNSTDLMPKNNLTLGTTPSYTYNQFDRCSDGYHSNSNAQFKGSEAVQGSQELPK